MKKFFIKISIILIIVFTGLYFLTKHLENRFVNNNNNKTTWIINRSGDTVDYAFLGSSKIYNLIDVKTFIGSTNLKAINLGTTGSSYTDNYLLLKKYLQKNKVRNLILEVDDFTVSNPKIYFKSMFHDYLFVPFMDKDSDIDKTIKDNSTNFNYYKWKYLPVTRYIEFNNIYFKPEYFVEQEYAPAFDEFGSELINRDTGDFKIPDMQNLQPDSNVISSIKNILELCKQNNVNVILLSTPHYVQAYTCCNFENVKNVIPSIVEEANIRYINFKNDSLEYNKELFFDNVHLDEEGAKVFTNKLKDSLISN